MKRKIISLLILCLPLMTLAQENADSTLKINEIQAANIDQYLDYANCYGGWIELYNPTSTDIALRGMYITDGETEFRFQSTNGSVPAKGFKTLWFDHSTTEGTYGTNARLQIPFKLESEGGTAEYGSLSDLH